MSKNRTSRANADKRREARRAADAALIEAASTRMDGDEAGDELAAFIAGRPGLARFSVKNCALLAEQAEQRGTDVSYVRTFNGWLSAGRQVMKGQKAFQLIVPRGTEAEAKGEGETKQEPPQEGEETERKPRFFLKAAWFDVSQTEPIQFESEQ